MSHRSWHKRLPDGRQDHDSVSTQLREVRNLLQSGSTADAFALMNTMLAKLQGNPVRQAAILGFTADEQMAIGNFSRAATIYDAASALASNDPHTYLRAAIGKTLALLKDGQASQAATNANSTIDAIVSSTEAYKQRLATLGRPTTSTSGSFTVGRKSVRPLVVARRLGKLFLAEGEVALAEGFFNRAIALEPNGSVTCQLALATIALQQGRSSDALDAALSTWQTVETITTKMLTAIPILVDAADQNERISDVISEITSKLVSAIPSVRSRAALILTKGLRARNYEALWKKTASDWLSSNDASTHPIIAAELRKLSLAQARIANTSPIDSLAAVAALLKTENLSPSEYLATVKEQIRIGCLQGNTPDFASAINNGVYAYGSSFQFRLMHGFAIACMMGRRHDLARPLLQKVINQSVSGSETWSRATSALARMEKLLSNFKVAATAYQTVCDCVAVAPRFRLKAKLEWLRCVVKGNLFDPKIISTSSILAITDSTTDYVLLLDFARQLSFAPAQFQKLSGPIFARGESLALTYIASAASPSVMLNALLELTRRRNDLFRYQDNINTWASLSEAKKDWLWSSSTEFWEYISLVCRAYWQTRQIDTALQVANNYLDDSATPAGGYATIAIPIAVLEMDMRLVAPAMTLFRKAVALAPAHQLCAYAYYWLALQACQSGSTAKMQSYAGCMLQSIGAEPTLQMYWQLEAKALCLNANLDVSAVSSQNVRHSTAELTNTVSQIMDDLKIPL